MKTLRNNKSYKKQQDKLLRRNNNWQSRFQNKLFRSQPNKILIIPNKLLYNQPNRPPNLSMSNQENLMLSTKLFRNNKSVRVAKLPRRHNLTVNLNRMLKMSQAKHKISQKTISKSLNFNKHDFINIIGIKVILSI